MKREKKVISYNPAILKISSEKDGLPHLMASRCNFCKVLFFPPQTFCSQCLSNDLESIELGNRGTLYSFTIVERSSLAPENFQVPFAYGYVDLPEGARILAKIINWEPGALKIGSPVEMTLEKIREDGEGNSVMAFRFAP